MNYDESNELKVIRKMVYELHQLHFGVNKARTTNNKTDSLIAKILLKDIKKSKR